MSPNQPVFQILFHKNRIPQDFIIRTLGSSLEGTAWETMYQTSKREVSHAVLDALELLCWRDACRAVLGG